MILIFMIYLLMNLKLMTFKIYKVIHQLTSSLSFLISFHINHSMYLHNLH